MSNRHPYSPALRTHTPITTALPGRQQLPANGFDVLGEVASRPFQNHGILIEIAAQSLKFHYQGARNVQTKKFSYSLGHEVYSTGAISEPTIRGVDGSSLASNLGSS